jgi:hypothetical protein
LTDEVEKLELPLGKVLADIAAAGGANDTDDATGAIVPGEDVRRCDLQLPPDSLPRVDEKL